MLTSSHIYNRQRNRITVYREYATACSIPPQYSETTLLYITMMKKITGFTMIEIMITIAIAGILAAVALPSFSNMQKNNCLTTSVNSLVSSLQRARSDAVKRRTNVTVSAASGDWSNGWNITLDEDRNGNGTLDSGEDYDGNGVLNNAAVVQKTTLSCGATITGTATSFVYGSDGFINNPGDFTVCDDRPDETGKKLSISLTGRPNLDSKYTGCN